MTDPSRIARAVRVARILTLGLAASMVIRGVAYVGPASPEVVPESLATLHSLMPLELWAIASVLVAVALVVGLWFTRVWVGAVVVYMSMQGAWIVSFVVSTVFGIAPRGWVNSGPYLVGLCVALALLYLGPPPRPRSHVRA